MSEDLEITEHPIYLRLIETGLFEDYTAKMSPVELGYVRVLLLSGEPIKKKLFIRFCPKSRNGHILRWHCGKYLIPNITFERAFEMCEPETQTKLLWHLDLFR